MKATDDKLYEQLTRSLKYGPYKDVKPLSYDFMRVHYKLDEPIPIFTDAERTIEVSHWGNIEVREHFEIFNEAAGINGEFSRVDYNSYNPNSGKTAIKEIESDLPVHIRGLSYYDFIGNISSSNALRTDSEVKFNIQPRFPIFGQWKTDFNQDFNLQTRHNLFYDMKRPNHFVLDVPVLHHYTDILAETYTLKIILPEGATNIKVNIPFEVDQIEESLVFSYLDWIGRPARTIKIDNAIAVNHAHNLQVTYTFESSSQLIEPVYVIGFLFSIFLFVIAFNRFEMHLEKRSD